MIDLFLELAHTIGSKKPRRTVVRSTSVVIFVVVVVIVSVSVI